ncbi:glycosyltransferase [Rhizorhabdus wittichii]|uniref:glycosyltransferase n=1 Tax=Rhizorhabdus wittichii TaxID=160791 RepID=UPI0002D724DF|nr:glycosyltransferase [Rhizorhabdus wittichii]
MRLPFVRRIRRMIVPAYGSTVATEHVARGDAARSRQDWAAAADAYRAAVRDQPSLVAIWIQLGHAQKEQGALAAAAEAYGQAAKLDPARADTHVFMAHIYKQLGRDDLAILHFLRALHAGETATHEGDELLRLLAARTHKDRSALIEQLRTMFTQLPPRAGEAPLLGQIRGVITEDMAPASQPAPRGPQPALVFDISDLISYYGNARLPTGIQRVQIETIEGALARGGDRDIRLCCFIDGRDDWLELPVERMRAIARLSTSGGDRFDPAWLEAVAGLKLFLSLTDPFEFPQGASLINLGTSWWLQNYFLYVRHAKATRGIRYIPFVHDMIPIMAPEHCTRGLTQDFISWVIGVFDHADHFLVNSQATRRDLLSVAATLGHPLDPDDVAVVPLDTDFRKPALAELPAQALDPWKLKPGGFVLFVSTVESRKGHMVAFETWAELIRRHGADAVPQLVCVGNRGWLNDRIYARLAEDEVLASKVSMLSRLSDEELALLYRSALFTVYPSLYEGWGLPVTESLCYGKVPLVSDAASLPEAGGPFAVYVEAGSVAALTDAAETLILDADHRAAAEAKIAAGFRPRAWSDLAGQIGDELDRFAGRDAGKGIVVPPPLTARVGRWHPLSRNESIRIWTGMRTGEGFRADLGWHWPENRGCRVRREGGALLLHLDGPHPPLRALFHLTGDDHVQAFWSLESGSTALTGDLHPDESKWIAVEIAAADGPHDVPIRIRPLAAGDGTVVTFFLVGFFLHATDDVSARQDFLEAITLNRLDSLNAFGEDDGARPTR